MNIAILIAFQAGLLAQTVLISLQPVIFGLSVLLIHARVGLGWAKDSYAASSPTSITLDVGTVPYRQGKYDLERGK
jgi:hypothetical protein